MFPESFAEHWIGRLSAPGDVILDPFCGRGTTPFQALLMGRRAMGNDINPVAYCVSRAKTRAPARHVVLRRITRLESMFDSKAQLPKLPPFFRHAFHHATLRQIMFLRERLRWRESDTDTMLAGLVLGALHGATGETSPYLSNQMPRTISTKPDYSIRFWQERGLRPPRRDAFELLRRMTQFRYASPPPPTKGDITLGDMRDLPAKLRGLPPPTLAITSPPYLDTTSFEEDQWLRLWFLGEPPHPSRGRLSPDDRHYTRDAYWRLIADMWRMFGATMAPNAAVVLRLGYRESPTEEVVEMLTTTAQLSRRRVRLVSYEESAIRRRQTDSFRPGAVGFSREIDAHFAMK
jgi:hypothetical protein